MEGILCVGNRLQNSPLQDKRKHPAIIPKDNHISKLIARYYHSIKGHSGLGHTLSLIREKFWIIHARSLLCRILSDCVHRRRRQAAEGQQKMATLPADRVIPFEPPFSFVGVDCFGPLEVLSLSLVNDYYSNWVCYLRSNFHLSARVKILFQSSLVVIAAKSSLLNRRC